MMATCDTHRRKGAKLRDSVFVAYRLPSSTHVMSILSSTVSGWQAWEPEHCSLSNTSSTRAIFLSFVHVHPQNACETWRMLFWGWWSQTHAYIGYKVVLYSHLYRTLPLQLETMEHVSWTDNGPLIRVSQKTCNPSLFPFLFLFPFPPHVISLNFTYFNTLFRKIFCVFPSSAQDTRHKTQDTRSYKKYHGLPLQYSTDVNITQLLLTLWIIMMTASHRSTAISQMEIDTHIDWHCCCPCTVALTLANCEC